MKYIISVDPGKDGTKCVGRSIASTEDKEIYFPTRIYNLRNGHLEVEGRFYKVSQKDNEQYIIGEQGEHYDNTTSKTSTLHKLAIFKNQKLKESYRDFIKEDGKIEVSVNDHRLYRKDYYYVLDRVKQNIENRIRKRFPHVCYNYKKLLGLKSRPYNSYP